MRLIDRAGALSGRPVLAYSAGFVAFAIAMLLRFAVPLPAGYPYLTFFPAVVLTAFVAGTGPAILCALLSGAAAWYWLIPPTGDFALDGQNALAIGFYVFIVAIDIALIHIMAAATRRLKAERERTARLYQDQRVLFQELQHRVANNMAFVSALLHLQKRRIAGDPDAATEAIDDATRRIEMIGRVHRRLYDPGSVDQPLEAYFRALCTDLVDSSGGGVETEVAMDDVRIEIPRLMTLSLLVTELVTNSLKHAFPDGESGRIELRLERSAPDRLTLTVADNGRGLPDGFDPATSTGLGARIVHGLAGQLDATVTHANDGGARTRLEFAAG